MKINPIMNYNQQKQVSHKGSLNMVSPLGAETEFDPAAISRVTKEFIDYARTWHGPKGDKYTSYLQHCVEVTKVIFEDSTFFWVNAKRDEVKSAIIKAAQLPNGECVTVGKPLLPMIYTFFDGKMTGFNDEIKKFSDANIKKNMEKCPNTVGVLDVTDEEVFDNDIDLYNKKALNKLQSTGQPSGGCRTKLLDQIVNWGKEE